MSYTDLFDELKFKNVFGKSSDCRFSAIFVLVVKKFCRRMKLKKRYEKEAVVMVKSIANSRGKNYRGEMENKVWGGGKRGES